ncbi:hypothetical protein ONZ43_g5544 [Nemania bipapillata]|uniref:Uncharacterized protein n=1 Tax=Nemania bipapillata TaxID=110536 RepID=A0ACC2I9C7_9PEZI|nr:hypothetical protein ONZ43_g5544 [Nemania bipapillata]
MQFTTLISTIAALAIGTNAAAVPRDGARLAQFRVFGADGCSALNYGFYTVDQSDAGACHELVNDPTPVSSVNLEALNMPAASGCTISIYTDKACSQGERDMAVNVCNNPAAAGETWASWKISCPSTASA